MSKQESKVSVLNLSASSVVFLGFFLLRLQSGLEYENTYSNIQKQYNCNTATERKLTTNQAKVKINLTIHILSFCVRTPLEPNPIIYKGLRFYLQGGEGVCEKSQQVGRGGQYFLINIGDKPKRSLQMGEHSFLLMCGICSNNALYSASLSFTHLQYLFFFKLLLIPEVSIISNQIPAC